MWQNLIGDMCQSDWRSFNTFSPRHVASFDWPKCFDFQGDTCNTRLDCMRHRLHVPGCLRHATPDWIACIIAYTCRVAYVIAYTCWTAYVIAYTCWTAYVIAYAR